MQVLGLILSPDTVATDAISCTVENGDTPMASRAVKPVTNATKMGSSGCQSNVVVVLPAIVVVVHLEGFNGLW